MSFIKSYMTGGYKSDGSPLVVAEVGLLLDGEFFRDNKQIATENLDDNFDNATLEMFTNIASNLKRRCGFNSL